MGKLVTAVVFSLLMLSHVGALADDDVRLNTMTLKENGRQENGGVVMNVPRTCTYNSYRFEIDLHGQLFVKESATCQGGNGQQLGSTDETRLVCQLDAGLHCTSKMEKFPDFSFAADARGLSANGAVTPWENPQQAAQLMPTIASGAARNSQALQTLDKGFEANLCPMVFDRFLVQFKRNGQVSSDSNTDLTMKSCRQQFQDICGNPQSKAQIVALAAASTRNNDINSRDIDKFCGAIEPK